MLDISTSIYLSILIGAVLLFFLFGATLIGIALLGAAFVVFYFLVGGGIEAAIADVAFNYMNSFVLIAIPLFVLMSEIAMRGGMTERMYRSLAAFMRRVPGGIGHANVLGCAFFACVCGSSSATAAAVGSFSIPEMRRMGYNDRLILGTVAGGGTLGILIPPSVPMIVYGALVSESVGQLFMAGIIPGVMITGLFMLYVVLVSYQHPEWVPPVVGSPYKNMWLAAVDLLPVGTLILMVLGGIYFGVVTPTESAALGSVWAIVLAVIDRRFNWSMLVASVEATIRTTCMIGLILIGAAVLSAGIGNLGLPIAIAKWIVGWGVPPIIIILMFVVLYMVLGSFFDPISMMVITLPVIYPAVIQLGYDSVWFCIFLVILMEAGMLTPPVGFNLFVIMGVGKVTIEEATRASLPFLLLLLIGLAVVVAVPEVALWLPRMLFKPG